MKYSVDQYDNPETNRLVWAVINVKTGVWYFPSRRGKKGAEALARKYNKMHD